MDIRCKVCEKCYRCPACMTPEECGKFEMTVDNLIDTAIMLSDKRGIEVRNALIALDICLKYGGSIDD